MPQSVFEEDRLPVGIIDDAVPLRKEDVAETLAKDVIGQDQACLEVAGVVTRTKSAVQDPKRPFGCLLLCGPTGVGKTQLAKSLAKYLFGASGEKVPLIRLDRVSIQAVQRDFDS